MDDQLFDKCPDLPDRTTWPAALVDAVDSGDYLVMGCGNGQVVLMSVMAGDLIRVGRNGTVQARIAINLETGEVTHPPPGVRISRWEADVLGKLERYEQRPSAAAGPPARPVGMGLRRRQIRHSQGKTMLICATCAQARTEAINESSHL